MDYPWQHFSPQELGGSTSNELIDDEEVEEDEEVEVDPYDDGDDEDEEDI